MATNFVISIELPDEEEQAIAEAKGILTDIKDLLPMANVKVSLTRQGDRSGGNLLLPRLNGRFGNHLPGRKAFIEEVLDAE